MAPRKQTAGKNVQTNNVSNQERAANDISEFLEKSCGLEIQTLNQRDEINYWIDSGSYAMNWIIGDSFKDGLPGSKAILLAGESQKGKSLIADAWLGKNIEAGGISFKIDIEDAAGFKFTAKIVGSEETAKQIRLISPKTLSGGKSDAKDLIITIERLTNIMNKLIDFQISKGINKNPSVLVVIDSVSQLSSDKEIQDIRDEKDKRDMTAQQKMRALFRAITQMLRHANVTMVGIAHLTANIGVMFGEKTVINAKGSAFGYASSLTLQAMSAKELIDPKSGVPIGIKLKFKTKKNRLAFKGRDCFTYLYFDGGIDRYGGLAELMVQYGLAKASAKAALDGGYKETVVFTYETLNGKQLKFKAHETGQVIEANGGEELLAEIEHRLNDSYKNKLAEAGVTELELLEQDGMDDESGLEDISGEQ